MLDIEFYIDCDMFNELFIVEQFDVGYAKSESPRIPLSS